MAARRASTARERAISELPTAYGTALRMRDAGASDEVIAAALAVPVESIPRLIEIGERKVEGTRRHPVDEAGRA